MESELYGSGLFTFVLEIVKSANEIVGSNPDQALATEQVRLQFSPRKPTNLRTTALTPSICKVEGLVLTPLSEGVCEIRALAEENDRYLKVEKVIQITIRKQSQNLVLNERSFVVTTRKGDFVPPIKLTSNLTPSFTSLSPDICKSIEGGKVKPLKSGECRLVASHPGNAIYEPANEVTLVGFVVGDGISLTCVKGKITKKVTGANPKCPKGYKKK